jgi:hypothetical protein
MPQFALHIRMGDLETSEFALSVNIDSSQQPPAKRVA